MSRPASERPRVGLAAFVVAAVLAAVQLGASCVDGATPDCSDPAVCAPSEGDASRGEDGSVVLPEAGRGPDASNNDGEDASDAADADVDGG